jgi:hypothetical protein
MMPHVEHPMEVLERNPLSASVKTRHSSGGPGV